ncbi:MAG: hypothetical protein HYZ00_14690 [Candidatus Hydrogenedentes bacterium]|nr:hypothetical protein [Candidatus Hydrogenedentota bacterium]
MKRRTILVAAATLLLCAMGAFPRYLEELRVGGGYASTPDGGIDLDAQGNLATDGALTVDGAASIGGNATIAGNASVTGALAVTGITTSWSATLPAQDGWGAPVSAAAGPTLLQHNGVIGSKVFDYDKDTDEYAVFQVMLPRDYDGRALRFTVYWMASAGTSGDVRWRVQTRCYDDGYDLGDATTTITGAVDPFQALNKVQAIAIVNTPYNASAGDLLMIVVRRHASDATDTFNADARLLALRVAYD